MKLHSIPPANRQRRARSSLIASSMRAATRTGFIFVGSHAHHLVGQEQSANDQPVHHRSYRVIAPDPKVVEMRRGFQMALASLAEQFEILCHAAEEAGEIEFWQRALAHLRDGS